MNKNNAPKSKSLSRKMIVPFASMMLIQGVLYLGAILGAGTISELNDNALSLFEHTASYREENLDSMMVKNWSLPENFDEALHAAKEELAKSSSKDNIQVSLNMAEQLELLLRNSGGTGAFVMYNDTLKDSRYPSFYIRDMDPAVYSKKDADLLVAYGPGHLVGEMGLTMDFTWMTDYTMESGEPFSIFYNELQAKADTALELSPRDLGRWSGKLKMGPAGQDVVVYCMPLLDSEHNMYGVVGVEVSLDYIKTFLPYEELALDGKGAYILGIRQEDGSYESVAKNTVYFESLAADGKLFLEPSKSKDLESYNVKDETLLTPAIAVVKPMRLYNSNTPFEDEQWALIGIAEKNNLFAPGIRLRWLLFWACMGALVLGAVSSVISTLIFSRPIEAMMKHLQNSGNEEGIHLPRVHVTEIDSLAEAVEKYSTALVESASRLSQVLRIMDQPLGAIEFDKASQTIYCTGLVGKMLNFSPENMNRLKFTMTEFEEEIAVFKANIEPLDGDNWQDTITEEESGIRENIVKCTGENGKPYWISFKTVEQQQKFLTVVQDVTDEVSEKIKIEYERDYDLLTNLLNRRSFRKRVMRLLEVPRTSGFSAMAMWDLDNLKVINDTYGHDFGDIYICEAAKVLQSLAKENTVVSRMSGDEFLVFFHNFRTKSEILNIVQATHNQLRSSILWLPDGENVNIKASAGIVWHINNKTTFEQLLKYADFAMYSAKDSVKGTIQEFDYKKYRREEVLFSSKDELKRFIDEKQMRFQFQPIVDAKNGEVFAFEAFMRPFGEHITSIIEMMHLAKAQSKLGQIEFMTFMGVMEAFRWQKGAFGKTKLFFNSIANSRLSMDDFATFKRRFGNDLYRLVVEITDEERKNGDCLHFKQNILKQWGVQLAIDDFVPDLHMERTLSQLAPQYIKIDMSITRNIDRNEIHQNKAAEILAFMRPRNILTIAEGIETKEEMDMLVGLGVDYLQGYYIGRPSFEVMDISPKVAEEIRSFYK